MSFQAGGRRFAYGRGAPQGNRPKVFLADLNPAPRGWFGYFKQALPSTFKPPGQMIRRRLRAFPRKQEKRPGTSFVKLRPVLRGPSAQAQSLFREYRSVRA